MIDARIQVAEEFAAKVFLRLFVRPKGWTDEQATEHLGICAEAIRPYLPRSRAEALPVTERAGVRLKADAKTNAWPTVREVLEAIRAVRHEATKAESTEGWPHRNSELVIERAAKWVREFRRWPGWLEFPVEVASDLLARGMVTDAQLAEAGYGPSLDRRVEADRDAVRRRWDMEAARGGVVASMAMPGPQATPAEHVEADTLTMPPPAAETDAQVAERVAATYRARYGRDLPKPASAAEVARYRDLHGIPRRAG